MTAAARIKQQRNAGLLTGAAAPVWILTGWLTPGGWIRVAVVAGVFLAGLLLVRWARTGRVLSTLALAGFVAGTTPALLPRPDAALAVWIGVTWLAAQLWLIPGLPPDRRLRRPDVDHVARIVRARASWSMAAIAALITAFSSPEPSTAARIAVCSALFIAAVFTLRARPLPVLPPRRMVIIAVAVAITASALWGEGSASEVWMVALSFVCALAASLTRPLRQSGVAEPLWWERLSGRPARQLVGTFLGLFILGTMLLALPMASAEGTAVATTIDAAFTAVSAVCVTGLIVRDTPVDWSPFGQATILALIQLGGLGIMTFATAFLGAVGRRLSLRQESAIAELTGSEDRRALYLSVRRVLALTFITELAGAVVLTSRFLAAGDTAGLAIWRGIFTSVSSFCNAGFALQSDSLIGYAGDPVILHTVGALVVLGGLSPAVVVSLPTLFSRRHLPLQTSIVLATTAILLVAGTLLIAATEWNHALAEFGRVDKLNNAWFQSVTLRTAGFNSIDFGSIRPPTVTLSLILMFVGGSPGGTAGGVKTTTLAVLVLAVISTIRRRRATHAFRREIAHESVFRAAAIVTLALCSLVTALLAFQLTQDIDPVPALFEIVSALGTVGLSMGATTELDGVGKIIVMVAMFVGRVGSLTLFVSMLSRREEAGLQYPKEPVDCG